MSSVNSGKSIRNENRRTSAGIFAFIFFEIKMGRQGFEPWKAEPTDLQSAPFDRSGTSPFFAAQHKPTQGFEPWTPRLQITCSGPAELSWQSH